jgi:FixJ family two-component response regulator
MTPEAAAAGPEPTVFVIDDDAAMRRALDALFRSAGMPVATHASTRAFLEAAGRDAAGCLVLDVRMPGESGLEFQRRLGGLGIRLPIVFISGHGDIPMSVAAMKAGAVEFLAKPFSDADLLRAVEEGLALDCRRRREAAATASLRERYMLLTARERQVMAGVVSGRLNKQIAFDLGLSEITIKLHRGQVMQKMAAASVVDLVRFADRLAADGAVPPPDPAREETKV